MSSSTSPFNPYSPPDEVLADFARPSRPGLLITVCVLAIVLGALGLLTGIAQAVGLVAGQRIQQSFQPAPPPGVGGEAFEIQKQMQDEIYAIEAQYFLPKAVLAVVHFVVALSLLVGGILALARRPEGRSILVMVCILAVCYEAGRSAIQVAVALKTTPVVEAFMEKSISAQPQGGNQQAQEAVAKMMKASVKIGMVIGFVLAGVIVLVKVVYYVASLIYLTRPKVKALFTSSTPSGNLLPAKP
jgi:hypothetical protein